MNNSNPFIPQGSLLEQQSKRRSRMKLGVFCVLAVSVTGLMAMLIQGCKREQPPESTDNSAPLTDTNTFAVDNTNVPPFVDASNVPPVVTNPPVTPLPPVAPVVETPAPAGTEYVIVKGDTLAKIAKAHGVTTKALQAANPGVEPTKLKVGQKLTVPASASGSAAPATSSVSTVSTGTGETYVVKSGDTLTKIAKAHGVTIKAIESENNLTTTKIKVGQKLKLPAKAETAAPAPAPAPVPTAPEPAPVVAPVTPLPSAPTK